MEARVKAVKLARYTRLAPMRSTSQPHKGSMRARARR